jgi:hypothetical protein
MALELGDIKDGGSFLWMSACRHGAPLAHKLKEETLKRGGARVPFFVEQEKHIAKKRPRWLQSEFVATFHFESRIELQYVLIFVMVFSSAWRL